MHLNFLKLVDVKLTIKKLISIWKQARELS